MDVTMLLCDAAAESGGKLYVLGGGWSVIRVPNVPTPMALAVKLSVPWDQTNKQIRVRAKLVTEDGDEVDLGEGPVFAEGTIEVGRPAGMKPGSPIDMPFALSFGPLALDTGGYVWELEVDGTTLARTPFRVLGG
jgi:hypothetical protein